MWKIQATKDIYYEIVVCSDLFNPQNQLLLFNGDISPGNRRFVVVDTFIFALYSRDIINYFKENNIEAKIIPCISREENKNIETYLALLEELNNFPINRRNEPIIAIGGGVLLDVVGFVASTYRRGTPYIRVPSTLMGYVDISTAIKTGLNFGQYKNRIGAFFPPIKVILDSHFLKTQDERHILNGVGEIVKLAVIKNKKLFELLESNGMDSIESKFQNNIGKVILDESIEDMRDELENNLFEDNLARIVDFGHTFSTVLEMQDNLNLLHGEAVTIDIVLSSILSYIRGTLLVSDLNRILELIAKLKLVTYIPNITVQGLWNSVNERTCHRNGSQQMPLPCGIGECIFANNIKYQEVESAYKFYKDYYEYN